MKARTRQQRLDEMKHPFELGAWVCLVGGTMAGHVIRNYAGEGDGPIAMCEVRWESGSTGKHPANRLRLWDNNSLCPMHTSSQIHAMIYGDHPEWFDPSLRHEAERRGMRSAPWAETKLDDVLTFLRGRFPR